MQVGKRCIAAFQPIPAHIGANLCGYSVDKKTSQNREQILINMRPGKDKWSGRIFDPNSGSTYDSTIAMKGTNTLRVQGGCLGGPVLLEVWTAGAVLALVTGDADTVVAQ